jgi:hypothetical protein
MTTEHFALLSDRFPEISGIAVDGSRSQDATTVSVGGR